MPTPSLSHNTRQLQALSTTHGKHANLSRFLESSGPIHNTRHTLQVASPEFGAKKHKNNDVTGNNKYSIFTLAENLNIFPKCCINPNIFHRDIKKRQWAFFSEHSIECCLGPWVGLIPRLHDQANIEQTSSWLVQLTRASSSSQLHRVNGV